MFFKMHFFGTLYSKYKLKTKGCGVLTALLRYCNVYLLRDIELCIKEMVAGRESSYAGLALTVTSC